MLLCCTNQEPFKADKENLFSQKPLDCGKCYGAFPLTFDGSTSCRSPITCSFLIDKLCKVTCAECSHFHSRINAFNSSFVLLKDVLTHFLQPEEGFNDSCLICFTNVFSPSFMLRLLLLLCLQTFLVSQSQ